MIPIFFLSNSGSTKETIDDGYIETPLDSLDQFVKDLEEGKPFPPPTSEIDELLTQAIKKYGAKKIDNLEKRLQDVIQRWDRYRKHSSSNPFFTATFFCQPEHVQFVKDFQLTYGKSLEETDEELVVRIKMWLFATPFDYYNKFL